MAIDLTKPATANDYDFTRFKDFTTSQEGSGGWLNYNYNNLWKPIVNDSTHRYTVYFYISVNPSICLMQFKIEIPVTVFTDDIYFYDADSNRNPEMFGNATLWQKIYNSTHIQYDNCIVSDNDTGNDRNRSSILHVDNRGVKLIQNILNLGGKKDAKTGDFVVPIIWYNPILASFTLDKLQ